MEAEEKSLRESTWRRAWRDKQQHVKGQLDPYLRSVFAAGVGAYGWFAAPDSAAPGSRTVHAAAGIGAGWLLYFPLRLVWQWAFVVPRKQRDEARERAGQLMRELAEARAPRDDPELIRLEAGIRGATIDVTHAQSREVRTVRVGAVLVEHAGEISAEGLTVHGMKVWASQLGYGTGKYEPEFREFASKLCRLGVLERDERPGQYSFRWTSRARDAARRLGDSKGRTFESELQLERAIGAIQTAEVKVTWTQSQMTTDVPAAEWLVRIRDKISCDGLGRSDFESYLAEIDRAADFERIEWAAFLGHMKARGAMHQVEKRGPMVSEWTWTQLGAEAAEEVSRRAAS